MATGETRQSTDVAFTQSRLMMSFFLVALNGEMIFAACDHWEQVVPVACRCSRSAQKCGNSSWVARRWSFPAIAVGEAAGWSLTWNFLVVDKVCCVFSCVCGVEATSSPGRQSVVSKTSSAGQQHRSSLIVEQMPRSMTGRHSTQCWLWLQAIIDTFNCWWKCSTMLLAAGW